MPGPYEIQPRAARKREPEGLPVEAEVRLQVERKRRSLLEAELAEAWEELARAKYRLEEERRRLEGELAAERERREDLELALDLLEKQHAQDAGYVEADGEAVPATVEPEAPPVVEYAVKTDPGPGAPDLPGAGETGRRLRRRSDRRRRA